MDKNLQEAQNQIQKLNQEIESLRNQLIDKQINSGDYETSMEAARTQYSTKPSSRDLNPILKQIRNKNLTLRERQTILFPTMSSSLPEDINYQWVSPSKLSIKRDKQWYWIMGLILMILITIAVIFREGIWIAVILAFFMTLMVNASIPAPQVVYKLTKQGIEVGEGNGLEIYSWGQFLEYAYYYKYGTEVLYVYTILSTPQRLQILFNPEDRKNINLIMEANLPYKPPPKKQGWLMKVLDGIYIPLGEFNRLQEKIDDFYTKKYQDVLNELQKEGKIPNAFTLDDYRIQEELKTQKILDKMKQQQEDEVRKVLGI